MPLNKKKQQTNQNTLKEIVNIRCWEFFFFLGYIPKIFG